MREMLEWYSFSGKCIWATSEEKRTVRVQSVVTWSEFRRQQVLRDALKIKTRGQRVQIWSHIDVEVFEVTFLHKSTWSWTLVFTFFPKRPIICGDFSSNSAEPNLPMCTVGHKLRGYECEWFDNTDERSDGCCRCCCRRRRCSLGLSWCSSAPEKKGPARRKEDKAQKNVSRHH